MHQRAIVREPGSGLASQWRFEGTNILIAEIKRDYRARQESIRVPYRALGLTDAEIDAALAFELPAITDVGIAPSFVDFEIQCVCGERRHTVARPPTWETDHCICGRTWRVNVGIGPGHREPAPILPNGGI